MACRLAKELYNITLERFGASSALHQLAQHGQTVPISVQFCITGFVIMSDWIASNLISSPWAPSAQPNRNNERASAGRRSGEQRWIAALDTNRYPAADLYASRFGWNSPTLRPMRKS